MKKFFISLLIIGSLLSLTFGLVIMPNMSGQEHSQCPFEAAGIVNCAQAQNLVGFMSAHVNAFSQFFLATSADGFAIFLTLFSLFALAVFVIFGKDFKLLGSKFIFISSYFRKSFSPNKILFGDWFALHENSPAFIARRS